jgi:hypothetical protein
MRRWPWDFSWSDDVATAVRRSHEGSVNERTLGWPFDRLAPKFPERILTVPWVDGVLFSLLAGWWMLAAAILVNDPVGSSMLPRMVLGYVCIFGAVGRLSYYASGYAPPISLWGRIRLFRWIIPSYDQVYVAPLVALLMGTLGPVWLAQIPGLSSMLAAVIAFTATLLTLFVGGPNLVRWRLTARARLVVSGKAGLVQAGS